MRANGDRTIQFDRAGWGYAAILLVAAGLRFALLGSNPLDDQQAHLALQALSISKGELVNLSGQPGYIALTSVLFDLFKASGFWSLFWPALFGTCAVLLPLLYRKWLSQPTALILAGLIALDPILIGASRTAGGTMMAIVAALAAFGFWLNKKPVLSGILLGIALIGGSGFWTVLLIFAGFVLFFGRKILDVDNGQVTGLDRPRPTFTALSMAAITALLLSTIFLSIPNGISAIGASLVEYFSGLGGIDDPQIGGNSLAWLIIELPLFVLGIWGFIDGIIKKEKYPILMGVWWGVALILALLDPGIAGSHFVWVTLPMVIFAALKLSDHIRLPIVENRLIFVVELILVLALIIFSLLNFLNLVNNAYLTPEETRNRIIGTFLPIILLAAMTVLFAWGWSYTSTRNGFVAGMVVLLLTGMLSNAWKSAGLGSRPQFEAFFNRGFPVGVNSLLTTLEEISLSNTGYAERIDIQVIGSEQPALVWALRNYNELRISSVSDPNQAPSLVLTDVETKIDLPASYRGQKILWTVSPDYQAMKAIDWVRWSIFRTAPASKTELILWARNDLFPGAQNP